MKKLKIRRPRDFFNRIISISQKSKDTSFVHFLIEKFWQKFYLFAKSIIINNLERA